MHQNLSTTISSYPSCDNKNMEYSNSTSYYSSSNNNSTYLLQNTEKSKVHNSLLHSVRKTKPMKEKASVAPIPQTQTKFYKVDPFNFKDLVHKLTSAPEFKPQQEILQRVKGNDDDDVTSLHVASDQPIVEISSTNIITEASPPMHTKWFQDLQSELFLGVETKESGSEREIMAPGFLDMNLASPSSYSNWCNFISLLSPRT